jgi:hypothetical protein
VLMGVVAAASVPALSALVVVPVPVLVLAP